MPENDNMAAQEEVNVKADAEDEADEEEDEDESEEQSENPAMAAPASQVEAALSGEEMKENKHPYTGDKRPPKMSEIIQSERFHNQIPRKTTLGDLIRVVAGVSLSAQNGDMAVKIGASQGSAGSKLNT